MTLAPPVLTCNELSPAAKRVVAAGLTPPTKWRCVLPARHEGLHQATDGTRWR